MIRKICIALILIHIDTFSSVCLQKEILKFGFLRAKAWRVIIDYNQLINPLYDDWGYFHMTSQQSEALSKNLNFYDFVSQNRKLQDILEARIRNCKSQENKKIVQRFLTCYEYRVLQFEQNFKIMKSRFPEIITVDMYPIGNVASQ